ncbi:hypothetical protein MOUN0_O06876 [Monosporozyma unispora]
MSDYNIEAYKLFTFTENVLKKLLNENPSQHPQLQRAMIESKYRKLSREYQHNTQLVDKKQLHKVPFEFLKRDLMEYDDILPFEKWANMSKHIKSTNGIDVHSMNNRVDSYLGANKKKRSRAPSFSEVPQGSRRMSEADYGEPTIVKEPLNQFPSKLEIKSPINNLIPPSDVTKNSKKIHLSQYIDSRISGPTTQPTITENATKEDLTALKLSEIISTKASDSVSLITEVSSGVTNGDESTSKCKKELGATQDKDIEIKSEDTITKAKPVIPKDDSSDESVEVINISSDTARNVQKITPDTGTHKSPTFVTAKENKQNNDPTDNNLIQLVRSEIINLDAGSVSDNSNNHHLKVKIVEEISEDDAEKSEEARAVNVDRNIDMKGDPSDNEKPSVQKLKARKEDEEISTIDQEKVYETEKKEGVNHAKTVPIVANSSNINKKPSSTPGSNPPNKLNEKHDLETTNPESKRKAPPQEFPHRKKCKSNSNKEELIQSVESSRATLETLLGPSTLKPNGNTFEAFHKFRPPSPSEFHISASVTNLAKAIVHPDERIKEPPISTAQSTSTLKEVLSESPPLKQENTFNFSKAKTELDVPMNKLIFNTNGTKSNPFIFKGNVSPKDKHVIPMNTENQPIASMQRSISKSPLLKNPFTSNSPAKKKDIPKPVKISSLPKKKIPKALKKMSDIVSKYNLGDS